MALASLVFSLQLNISVQDKDQTRLYGTNVDILRGDEVVASKATEKVQSMRIYEQALAQFELEQGVYFVRLRRASYPDSVSIIDFSQSTQLNLVILIHKPTFTVYGQIVDEPASKWDGQTIYVIDEGGSLAAQSKVHAGGYYAVALLDPTKTYTLRLGNGTDKKESAPFRYTNPGIYYLKIDLSKPDSVLANATPAITAPANVQIGEVITAYLREGTKQVSYQKVNVSTPKGDFEATTDENGVVHVGAGDYGEYTIEWMGQRAAIEVAMPQQAQENTATTPPTKVSDTIKPPAANPQQPQDALVFGAGIAGAIIIAALVLGVCAVAAIAYFLGVHKPKKNNENKKAKK
ncbi:MAG: hypothetical protein V1822_03925 [Candidatus Micrarchaeota archaeon]